MPAVTVRFAANFARNLDDIQAFLSENDAPRAFDALLDNLFGTVIPNLERFPLLGRDFMARRPDSIEGLPMYETLKAKLGGAQLLEYVHGTHLLLYALRENTVYLLAIQHHRQLSFDLSAFWL